MPRDLEGLADLVVLTVKNAMAPYQERIALLEKDNTDLRSQLAVVGVLRDRVVAVETKAAMPIHAPAALPEPVDLSPLQERVTVLEKDAADLRVNLAVVADLRDRVVVAETKAALLVTPPVELPERVDLAPLTERMALLEQTTADVTAKLSVVTDLRDRVVVVETKAAMPMPTPPAPVIEKVEPIDLGPVWERMRTMDREQESQFQKAIESIRAQIPTPLTLPEIDARIVEKMTPVQALVADARERLAAVEVRQPIPGPPGKDGTDGTNGKDGAPGKDGVDGVGFDDIDLVADDARKSCFIKFIRGDRVKEFRLPTPYDVGPYREGQLYEKGHGVSWDGSWWIAKEATTAKPGDGVTAWRLVVKKGREGKPGRDANGNEGTGSLPVVRAGR